MAAWTEQEESVLRGALRHGRSLYWIAERLDRSYASVRSKAQRLQGPPEASKVRPAETFPDWEIPEDVDWREWFDGIESMLDLHKRMDPTQEILTVDLRRREKDPAVLMLASDFHMGGGYTDHKAILETVELLLDTPGMYVATIGDMIEGFIPGEKSAETVEQMAVGNKPQLAMLRSLITELAEAGKILCMSWGDHDSKWFEKLVGLNIVKQTFHDRVPYFTGRGLMRILLGDQEYWVMVNHGESFRSQWNQNHPQRRQYERFFPADLNVSGHLHKPAFQMAYHYEMLREAGLNVGGKHWLVQTGTFKTGPDPYTIRSWSRGILGVPSAVFHLDRHDVDLLDAPDKAVAYRNAL